MNATRIEDGFRKAKGPLARIERMAATLAPPAAIRGASRMAWQSHSQSHQS